MGLTGGRALADNMKYNYSLAVLDVAGNDIPDEYLIAIGKIAVSLPSCNFEF